MGFLGKLLDKRKNSKINKEAMRSAQALLEDKLSARGRVSQDLFNWMCCIQLTLLQMLG